jgi:NAD-dependent SIR2 family protein deacetylase
MADGNYERANPEAICGCYNCQRIFSFKEIEDFWDAGETPVCPSCGMDTVVVESADMQVTPERLFAMRRTY